MAVDRKETAGPHIVISQLPPPHHGSTVMTQVFLDTLDSLKMDWRLVDRRFSKSVGEVGQLGLLKFFKSFHLIGRLLSSHFLWKPQAYVLFITNRPASFLVDWAMTEVLRLLRRPIINYVHTTGFTELAGRNKLFGFLVKRALGSAQRTVCLGASMESDISWAVDRAITRIPNTPYQVPSPTAVGRGAAPTFLFLSNLLPEKGAARFIDAALELASLSPSSNFVVAGASPDRATLSLLEAKISESPYRDRILLAGSADEETKWRLLDTSHVLVFPSTYAFEAQPLTIVEAMCRGLPVIAFDTGGIRDLVIDGHTGYLLESRDHRSLVESMLLLAGDEGLREKLGNQARKFYEAYLSRSAYELAWAKVLLRM